VRCCVVNFVFRGLFLSRAVDIEFVVLLLLEINNNNNVIVGLMILLAVAMALIATVAISALIRRRATGQLSSA